MKKSFSVVSVIAIITLGIALSFNLFFIGARNNPISMGIGNTTMEPNQVKIVDFTTEIK